MSEIKHFNAGNVFGKILEVRQEESEGGKEYLQIQVDVSGDKSGRVTAYCRMWNNDHGRIHEFMDEFKANPTDLYWFKGFLGQYVSKQGDVMNNFTVFQWERKKAEKRAVFILKGEVSHHPSGLNCGGQMIKLVVRRDGTNGQQQEEEFEVWAPGEDLLEPVSKGDLIEVKGLIRQKDVDDFYGGSDGPIRAFVGKLAVIQAAQGQP